MNEFQGFPKISRFSRDVVVTEKLDGTNAQVVVSDDGLTLRAGSRTRWITPEDDNFGFARWVEENKTELLRLGPGQHFGEWWGAGIQRKYGLKEKRFSLFNTHRWSDDATRPACCHVVPVLYTGIIDTAVIDCLVARLAKEGSVAVPGFTDPEGVVIFHTKSSTLYKKTCKDDDKHKGEV